MGAKSKEEAALGRREGTLYIGAYLSSRAKILHGRILQAAEDAGEAVQLRIDPPGAPLMVQRIRVAGREFPLVMPQSVDAIMDAYIQQGLPT